MTNQDSRCSTSSTLFMRLCITVVVLVIVPCLWIIGSEDKPAAEQGPERVGGQRLKAPTIPQLVEAHQDLTYDGLVKALPDEPAYRRTLDFDPTKVRYFDSVRKELDLTDEEVEIFRRCGFVSLDNGRRYTFTTAYYDIYASDLPVLITSDSILHGSRKGGSTRSNSLTK